MATIQHWNGIYQLQTTFLAQDLKGMIKWDDCKL